MCGIIGSINFSRKYKIGMEKTISELLFCDTLRGTDATGIYAVNKDMKIDWAKECINGWDFPVYNKRGKAILRQAEEHTFIIGHNRAATKGNSRNVDYAHPIVIENKLGLVHNGTLTAWPKDRGADCIEHDSTSIAQTIAEAGVQEFVDTHDGAYSLVWHNVDDNTLNFLRNDERPMAMMYSDDVIFFGSELGMLVWVGQRNSFRLAKHFYTEPMMLYTFEPGSAEPRTEKIVKNFSSSARRRFLERDQGPYSHYHVYPRHGTVVDFKRYSSRTSGSGTDDGAPLPELVRARQEAERLAEVTRLRNEAINAERTARSEEDGERKGGAGEGSRRRARVAHSGPDQRPKVRLTNIIQYKEFYVGKEVMFSAVDYGEIKEHEKGQLYTLTGEPHHAHEHPRVQIRSTVKVKDFPQEKLQHTTKYLWGKIQSIHETEMGNLIIWVSDIRESAVEDPNSQLVSVAKRRDTNTDEVAEAVVQVPTTKEAPKRGTAALEGKEFCQGCNTLFPKTSLKQLFETWTNPATKRSNTNSFRFCADCLVTYACDRDKVVPAKARGIQPTSANIQKYH